MNREKELEEKIENGTADQRDREIYSEIKEGLRDKDGFPLVSFL